MTGNRNEHAALHAADASTCPRSAVAVLGTGVQRLSSRTWKQCGDKLSWLVVDPPLLKILVGWDDYIQYIENKKCSKPPINKPGMMNEGNTHMVLFVTERLY